MASHIYSVPEQEILADRYDVLIDGVKVPLQRMYVSSAPINRRWPGHQREITQREEAYFVLFSMEGETTVTVDCKRDFQTAVVRPLGVCSSGAPRPTAGLVRSGVSWVECLSPPAPRFQ